MQKQILGSLKKILGVILILLGIIGLFLPILQGLLMIFAGLLLLGVKKKTMLNRFKKFKGMAIAWKKLFYRKFFK